MKKTIVRSVSTAALLSTVFAGSAYASTYTVQKGDTLSKIASKYQTTVPQIKGLNGLTSDMIYVNQTLKVTAEAAVQPAVPTPAPAPVSTSDYVVKSGDYLGKIAKQFSTTVAELKSLNGLNSDLIFVGQTLKVSAAVTTPATPPPAVTPPTPPVEPSTTSVYTVVNGDTLSKIGLQVGMSVQELKTLNGLNSDRIYIGQQLNVKAQAPVVTTPAPVAPVAPVAPPSDVKQTTDYTVKSGDTLGSISLQYKMSLQDLMSLNGLNSHMIYVGQVLKVAGQAPTVVTPATGDFAAAFVNAGYSVMGIPYAWGGSSLKGFDCSGFIYYAANLAGKKIGRYSAEGYYSRTFYVDQPQAGDLVFFENTYKKGISHVGIYIGNNQFLHADEKKGVTISSLTSPYYTEHFDGFKRFY
ncbi:LysM peptidoglycan-binding domain-containing protein [Neobacillus niacini]|uniref:C40 family peptidase n=1 Tax=Neobacillus niacini TaxID=86668 RepID=UPI003B020060